MINNETNSERNLMICLAIFTQYRQVMPRWSDRQTDRLYRYWNQR